MIDLDSWFCLTAFQELTIFHCMVLKCQDLCLYKNLTSTQHYFCQVPHCGRLSQIQEKLFDVDLPLEYMIQRVKIVWLWMRGWCQYNHRHFRSPGEEQGLNILPMSNYRICDVCANDSWGDQMKCINPVDAWCWVETDYLTCKNNSFLQ